MKSARPRLPAVTVFHKGNLDRACKRHDSSSKDRGLARFESLIRTYFTMGGPQLQVNCLDREALIAARNDPEHHQDLVVRVWGFSERFVLLNEGLQQEVIDRTVHAVA